MRKIYITDDCVIYNDMPRRWRLEERWHESLYDRWRRMWNRCNNPNCEAYKWYKDCKIDNKYKYLSNYVNDIMTLENFDKLCENPFKWHIDKDKKDSENRHYFYEYLSILPKGENSKESLNRNINVKIKKSVIGISIKSNSIVLFKYVRDADKKGFDHSAISKCCKKKLKTHKGYKWKYLNYKHNKKLRKIL